jgi:hypothetical protein
VIERLARCHFTPSRRASVAPMVSAEIGLSTRPSSKATCAAISKVQRLEFLPNSLGERWSNSPARPQPALDPRRPYENGVRMLGAWLKDLLEPLLTARRKRGALRQGSRGSSRRFRHLERHLPCGTSCEF